MCADQVPFLLVSGPPGVGKTTVAWEVFDRLVARGEHPAMADLDLLGVCWPVPDDDPHNERLKARNLRAVWQNYAANGATCLVAAGVIENGDVLGLYRAAVDGARVAVCRLRGGDQTLQDRIAVRGRERGAELDKLSRRAIQLATELDQSDVAGLVVDTDGLEITDVADRVLASGWPSADLRPGSG